MPARHQERLHDASAGSTPKRKPASIDGDIFLTAAPCA
jgi:hypothetical protein